MLINFHANFELLMFLQYTVCFVLFFVSIHVYHLTGSSEFILKLTYNLLFTVCLVLDHSKN